MYYRVAHGPRCPESDMSTLEERVAALEARVDAHAMSGSDLRGALLGLQDEMHRLFEQVDRRFEQVDRRFEQVDRRFEQMDQRFTDLQRQMNQRFDAADQKVDRHFTWLVGIQVAVLVAVVGALVGSYYR
jgi:tetrahydromethanopterin S-methyltransferase subunit G